MNESMASLPVEDAAGKDAAAEQLLAQRATANTTIKNYALMALGAGLVPSPLVDSVAITAMEVKMIADLGRIYEFPVPHKLVALKVLISLASSVGMIYLAIKFNSLVKLAPGVGHALHTSVMVVSSGAAVYAVGKIFQEYYESGGFFLDKSDASLRRSFKEKYRDGMEIVPRWVAAQGA